MTLWRLYRLDVNVVPASHGGLKGCLATLQDDTTRERKTLFIEIADEDFADPDTLKGDINTAFGVTYTPNDFT